MARNRMGFFTFVISIVLGSASVPALAQGDPIGAVDNIPPEAPSNIDAVADLGVPNITVTWDLSPSDGRSFTSTTGGGSGSQVVGNDVESYIIKVSDGAGAEAVEIARVSPGEITYVDDTVISGPLYIYQVSAFDGTNESDAIASFPVSIGEPPSVSIEPADPFALGVVTADGTTSETLNLFNGGPGALTVWFEYDLADGFVASFVEDLGTAIGPEERFEIESGGQLQLFVGFDAALVGNLNGDFDGLVIISTNDPENRLIEVELAAAIEGATEVATIDVRDVLAFGAVAVGGSSPKTLEISNIGGLTLNAELAVSSGLAFSLGSTSLVIEPGESAEVEVIFTADDNIFYDGIITITSDDPFNPSVDVQVKGLGKLQGEGVKPVTRKIVKARVTFPISLDFTDPVAVADCALNAAVNIQASLAAGFLVINVTCTEGSTIVDFEVVADADAEGEPAITVEESLADLIADIEDPAVEVFPDLVGDLGAVDTVVDETETVSLQPTDADGADIVGWFSRTGTRVDFDDFFLFADGFGSTVDSEALDVLDIAGPSQGPPDGLINFNDFFRFADDFGKTVANAAEIQLSASNTLPIQTKRFNTVSSAPLL